MKITKWKNYNEALHNLNEEQIDFLNDNCQLNDNCEEESYWEYNQGFININGNFNCSHQGLLNFKGLKFGIVTGMFNCSSNNLKSLEGAPLKAHIFNCERNSIQSLEHAPKDVSYEFRCGYNQITSLKGCFNEEKIIVLECNNNKLTTLEGCPKIISKFDCSNNKLKNLKGGPTLCNDYDCSNNELTTLEGSPIKTNEFDCHLNTSLETLEHGPKVCINYNCTDCSLINLKGAPRSVNFFDCNSNKLTSLEGDLNLVKSLFCSLNNLTSLKCNINKSVDMTCSPQKEDGLRLIEYVHNYMRDNDFKYEYFFEAAFNCINKMNQSDIAKIIYHKDINFEYLVKLILNSKDSYFILGWLNKNDKELFDKLQSIDVNNIKNSLDMDSMGF
jgi:hypothetical protein